MIAQLTTAAFLVLAASAAPAAAATFTYIGAPLQNTGNTGFNRVKIKFNIPGPIVPNTSYSTQTMVGYYDGPNRLAALESYMAKGRAYGGQLDAYMYMTVTTDSAGKPASWTFKVNIYFKDNLGNEGYDLYVNGPGNESTCPMVDCGYDSIITTLPETLPTSYNFVSKAFGTLTYVN